MLEPFIGSNAHHPKKVLTQAEKEKLHKSYAKVPSITKAAELQHTEEDIPEAEKLLDTFESKKSTGQAKVSE